MKTRLLTRPRASPITVRYSPTIESYLKKYHQFYLMLVPVIVFYIVLKYLPMYGIVIAFKNYRIFRGVAGSEWVGFEVFARAFEQPSFWRAFVNTIRRNLLSLIFGFPAPIIFALLLNQIRRRSFKKVVQSISYLPPPMVLHQGCHAWRHKGLSRRATCRMT